MLAPLRWLFAAPLAIAGCSAASTPPSPPAPSLPGVCARQHDAITADGDPVVVCDALWDEAPLVRLPPDDPNGSAVYVAFDERDDSGSNARTRTHLFTGIEVNAADFRAPSNRYVYTVYRLEGTVRTETSPPPAPMPTTETFFTETHAAPVLLLPQSLFLPRLAALEGTLDAPDGTSARVRVAFDRVDEDGHLPVLDDRAVTLPDGAIAKFSGRLENLSQGVRAANGDCIPPLPASVASIAGDGTLSLELVADPSLGLPLSSVLAFGGGGRRPWGPPYQQLPAVLLGVHAGDPGGPDFAWTDQTRPFWGLRLDAVRGGGGGC